MWNRRRIKKISKEFVKVKKTIFKLYNGKDSELSVQIMLSPYQIAKLFGLKIIFSDLEGDVPSFFSRTNLTIYISQVYIGDDYAIRQLCAHELGHFFLHKKLIAEMNNFASKEIEEYEANVFSILLMPQIMKGEKWQNMKPKILNDMMYKKIKK